VPGLGREGGTPLSVPGEPRLPRPGGHQMGLGATAAAFGEAVASAWYRARA